jgi:uncharacterized membrane protein
MAASVAGAVALSAALVWALPFHSVTNEILARTNPNLLDLGVALLSGLAGSLVLCRGGMGGGVTALPGVAIAVALMPPLCTTGFGVGSGWNWSIVSGAALLFLTNLAAIVTSAFIVFFVVRMDAPAVRDEIDRYIQRHAAGSALSRLIKSSSACITIPAAVNSIPQSWMLIFPSPCRYMIQPGDAASQRQPSGATQSFAPFRTPSPIWLNHKSCEFCRNVTKGSS